MLRILFKRALFLISLFISTATCYAAQSGLKFIVLPNIKTQYLMATNAVLAIDYNKKAIALVEKTLNINSASSLQTVRIRFIYSKNNVPRSLIVYLLSSKNKGFQLVRINLNSNFTVANVIHHYRLKPEDLAQSPNYAEKTTPVCPDPKVQFVIGNNFFGDESVKKEVHKVYQYAESAGYHPILLTVNDPNSPQPTIHSYENWMSCKNVKGFYNESHGANDEILLSDGDFMYSLVDKDLIEKLKNKIVLFDSCDTFNDPLLAAMTKVDEGDSQKYIAGIVPLPFGSSERTASCIWQLAIEEKELTQSLIEKCANNNQLPPDSFRIAGNGSSYLHPAVNN